VGSVLSVGGAQPPGALCSKRTCAPRERGSILTPGTTLTGTTLTGTTLTGTRLTGTRLTSLSCPDRTWLFGFSQFSIHSAVCALTSRLGPIGRSRSPEVDQNSRLGASGFVETRI
jgi:hypothetical protein